MSMVGKSLIHYEITSQIGKGGMGEVYQARDTKLGRDVAIKVLPEEFAMDHDRVARFQREAKLLASLNHPNIAAIYGLEESDGTHFLVMELIEGETLKDRIKSGPISVEEALQLALQMAEALEAAHERGVIHRDLKPANIKVTPDGKVKVLDFGLAKAFAGDSDKMDPADSPTLSAAATQQGVILGTAAYMSPEQARGKLVDKRADIWAFGAVLYEMLTGQKAFAGGDTTDTLAAVLRSEPEWDSLPANLHWRLKELLERCLEKKAKDRYGSISDARVDIKKVLADPSGVFAQPVSTAEPRKKLRVGVPAVAVIAILCLITSGAAIWYLKPAPPPEPKRVTRFTYELPEDQQFTSNTMLAVSPDGSQFVYLTTDGLFLRSVDALDARLITGTNQNSVWPVFSPDGKWIAYWSSNDQKLKKFAISGGVPVVLCDTGMLVVGLSWSSDNTIVYSDILGGGLKRVSADGGTPESLIEADVVTMGTGGMPVFPQMLPDGKTMLFANAISNNEAENQITVQSLESEERKALFGGTRPMYLSSGHLVFSQVNNNIRSLAAVPFDPDTMEVMGGPVPLLENIRASALSDSGTLVYISQLTDVSGSSDETESSPGRKLVWVDRKGQEEPIQVPPYMYRNPRISPDGTKVALYFRAGGNQDIWIWDFLRETLTRLTFHEGDDFTPLWTPDGLRIAFCSIREEAIIDGGLGGIFMKAADGTGEVEYFGTAKGQLIFPYTWSADGNTLVTAEIKVTASSALPSTNEQTNPINISMFSMEGDHERTPLIQGNFMETQPRISPDGKWLAYSSDESGRSEIYVRPFPEVNKGKWQVSTGGGVCALWSPDGKELFYLIGSTEVEAVMGVAVETEPVFKPGKPRLLFRGRYIGPAPDNGVPWDIHPDGERFLLTKPPEATEEKTQSGELKVVGPRKINIVLNWDEELKQRVPVN